MKGAFKRPEIVALLLLLSTGCGSRATTASSQCAATKSVIAGASRSSPLILRANAGLLLSTHFESASHNWDGRQILSKCNTYLESIDSTQGRIRLWTASHCLKPLLLTSIKLAVRDENSSIGGFLTWNLSHPILEKGALMRTAFSQLSPFTYPAARDKLNSAFDRSKMWVSDGTSVLAPRTSCENLRWSVAAESLHTLCFSIHDLMSLDVTLPDLNSTKSKALLTALASSPQEVNTRQALQEKQSIFLRKIGLLSQVEWITAQEQNLKGIMENPQSTLLTTEPLAAVVTRLQKTVFDLPQSDEFDFMTPVPVTTQDRPAGQNETFSVIRSGTYRTTSVIDSTLDDVHVACIRPLKKYEDGAVKTYSEIEYRPHAFCPGGSNPQSGHVWYRNYQWSRMVPDLVYAAAKNYTAAIVDQLDPTSVSSKWTSRLSVVSNFTTDDRIDFFAPESEAVSPFLNPLRLPASFFSTQLFGWQNFSTSGAFLLALDKASVKARFLKGDSGALLLLDGVPIATLYSVDGEETSGGASILPLPAAESDEDYDSGNASSATSGTRNPAQVSAQPGKGKTNPACLW